MHAKIILMQMWDGANSLKRKSWLGENKTTVCQCNNSQDSHQRCIHFFLSVFSTFVNLWIKRNVDIDKHFPLQLCW